MSAMNHHNATFNTRRTLIGCDKMLYFDKFK